MNVNIKEPDELVKIEISNWEYVLYSTPNKQQMFFHVVVCAGAVDWSFTVELSNEEILNYQKTGKAYLTELHSLLNESPKIHCEQRGIKNFEKWQCYKSLQRET